MCQLQIKNSDFRLEKKARESDALTDVEEHSIVKRKQFLHILLLF